MYVISFDPIIHLLCADTRQWLTFSAVSSTASQFFQVSESAINWLSTGFLFAFVIASPYIISTKYHQVRTNLVPTDSLSGLCTEVPELPSLLPLF